MSNCLICDRINQIQKGENPHFVIELETGFVVIGDHQYYRGYTLFLSKKHVFELHQLPANFRKKFLMEMSLVAQAVYETFKPKKLNYELLGNTDKHLHWHLYPRYQNDPCPNQPIWCLPKKIRCNNKTLPKPNELKILTQSLRKKIDILLND
jgi:diadenosine tetraphosphate (Ap4A) HIT family hydrolase